MPKRLHLHRGFTIIELVMVITVMGIVASIVAVFMKSPIDAYMASSRRAALTDAADTTTRRMARDIRRALPNSMKTTGTNCIEFIPVKTGGRYRADDTAAGLNFSAADTSFNMFGSNSAAPAGQRIAAQDVVVVYNLGITGSDAYAGDNISTVSATPTESGSPVETSITIASKLFPLASGSNRFHVVDANEKVLAYVCSGNNLYRTASTTFTRGCPTTGALIARNVSACSFEYSGTDMQRNAVVRLSIQITDSGETVSLYQEVNVNNTP